jgi:hypothetical protein
LPIPLEVAKSDLTTAADFALRPLQFDAVSWPFVFGDKAAVWHPFQWKESNTGRRKVTVELTDQGLSKLFYKTKFEQVGLRQGRIKLRLSECFLDLSVH